MTLQQPGASTRAGEANEDLERQIRQRTAELVVANEALTTEIRERRRLDRARRALSRCNQALLRAGDEPQLLKELCRVIVEVAGYRLCWVGYVELDEAKTVRPVAHAGYEDGYLETVRVTWADTERGRGPVGTAIRTREPAVFRDVTRDSDFAPWRRRHSAAAIPPRSASPSWRAPRFWDRWRSMPRSPRPLMKTNCSSSGSWPTT